MNLSLPRMPIIVEPTTMLVVHTCVAWVCNFSGVSVVLVLVLVLVLIKDHLNHQKDAHPKGIRIPGFLSYIRVYKLT